MTVVVAFSKSTGYGSGNLLASMHSPWRMEAPSKSVTRSYGSGAEKDPQSQMFTRTLPKNSLNNLRALLMQKGFEANFTRKFTRKFSKVFVTQALCGSLFGPEWRQVVVQSILHQLFHQIVVDWLNESHSNIPTPF